MATALFTRWFQSKVFTPGDRLHRESDAGEAWEKPAPSQRVLVDFIRLRRRLAPYALATRADDDAGRSTAFPPEKLGDYASKGRNLRAFSFGPSLLVQPAPAGDWTDLPVFLPAGTTWFDFWTGASYAGGQVIRTPAPINVLPLFVRSGAILPLSVHEPTEKAAETLEIRIYPGANGRLVLPEFPNAASGPNETGAPPSVSLEWDDQARELRIGARQKEGAGLAPPSPIRFHIVVVRPGYGAGPLPPPRPDQRVVCEGDEHRLSFPAPPPPPSPPVGLAAKVHGERIRFTWKETREGMIYRLKRTLGLNGPCEDIASGLHAPGHTAPLPSCGSRFKYIVTAMNAGGESPPSEPVEMIREPVSSPLACRSRLLGMTTRAAPDYSRSVAPSPTHPFPSVAHAPGPATISSRATQPKMPADHLDKTRASA